MDILNKIKSPADVKNLTQAELIKLCAELREEITKSVAKTGGHLASNLGVVELTAVIHRVYDTSRDRLVFDVGHQCYAHKMLTGRLGEFDTLRQFDGIAGFPKPSESIHDAAIAGHASVSVSNALGMARARTLLGEDYDVIAVIGDGALTGGTAYEGLSDCGESGEPIVVVLNDNGMSINPNVGGIARLVSRQRVKPSYLNLKRAYRAAIGNVRWLYFPLHRLKEWVKNLVFRDNMFEDMGFAYLGPVDGHDVFALEHCLRYARDMACPVILHIVTQKGRGYAPAESEPGKYHGVSSFRVDKGLKPGEKTDFSAVFGNELCALAEEDNRVAAITAAMGSGTGLSSFAEKFPKRIFDVGIAEGHAVSLAAGMAKQGLRPVFAVYSTFLQRSYDMLIHDAALDNLPITLAVDRAGIVGADGETHNGVFDAAFLATVPNMSIYSPSNYAELRSMLRIALNENNPSAVRYPRGSEGEFTEDTSALAETVLREGSDITIVSYGILINEALAAAEIMTKRGMSAEVVKINRIAPADFSVTIASAAKTGKIIVVEDCCQNGSVGERILAAAALGGVQVSAELLNAGDGIVPHGDTQKMWKKLSLDAGSIAAAGEKMVKR
ncbi:MAG: 1-deoxy-D-xylulose-5-phosphate synthase [Oscillospiraceae bacterium]|nr:1-deoxy-D-xylulose-5-phosphate synthase [Oscillospiraceae bacterium]